MQEQLGEMIGKDSGYISKIEVGRNFPSINTLEKIANTLKIDLYKLFEFAKITPTNFKTEIVDIYEKLNKEKQYTLYRVAKDLL